MTRLRKLLQTVLVVAVSCLPLGQGSHPITPFAYTCPSYTLCNDCPSDWIYRNVNMNYKGKLTSEDLCDVTFSWDYDYVDGNTNPLLVFICNYADNSEFCDAGWEDQCGSCGNFTLYDLMPSRYPGVTYTDSCGWSDEFLDITASCSETLPTTPKITTTTTTTPEPLTTTPEIPTTTPEPLTTTPELPTTTPEPLTTTPEPLTTTPEPLTTMPEPLTTTPEPLTTTAEPLITTPEPLTTTREDVTTMFDASTTTASGGCPGTLQCAGCPQDWGSPNFTLDGRPTGNDLCDVEISWQYHGIINMIDNPSLNFICIYGGTAHYCPTPSISTCGTCLSVTFYDLDPTLTPYIDYTDTCSNLDQFVVAEDCETSTIAPPVTCPLPTECSGCPSDWLYPSFLIKEIPTDGDLCTVDISWDYDYSEGQEDNPSLDFTCIYSANGEYCENSPRFTCGSCENVIFYDLDPSLTPYIDYTDTCGNIIQFPVAENCASATPAPPYCPDPSECFGCPVDWGYPTFTVEGTLNDEDLCDVKISWDYVYSPGQSVNPSLNFLCIYDANGEYCKNSTVVTCGSCNMVIFYDLDPSLNPYIDYGDTCSNVNQFIIGSDCSLATPAPPTAISTAETTIITATAPATTMIKTTPMVTTIPVITTEPIITTEPKITTTPIITTQPTKPPTGYCPDYHLCHGCPAGYTPPAISQSGELMATDYCTLELTWDYPLAIGNDTDIPRMVFVCIYPNFEQCEPLNEDICASCEKFVIHGIHPSQNPVIQYSDTCGYIYDIEVTGCPDSYKK